MFSNVSTTVTESTPSIPSGSSRVQLPFEEGARPVTVDISPHYPLRLKMHFSADRFARLREADPRQKEVALAMVDAFQTLIRRDFSRPQDTTDIQFLFSSNHGRCRATCHADGENIEAVTVTDFDGETMGRNLSFTLNTDAYSGDIDRKRPGSQTPPRSWEYFRRKLLRQLAPSPAERRQVRGDGRRSV